MVKHGGGVAMAPVPKTSVLSTTAIVAIGLAGTVLLVTTVVIAFICYRRRGSATNKLLYGRRKGQAGHGRRAKALRSPCGQTQYLRKNSSTPASKTTSPVSDAEEASLGKDATAGRTAPVVSVTKEDETSALLKTTTSPDLSPTQPIVRQDSSTHELGQLHFSIRHDTERAVLVITVLKCMNLPSRATSAATTDPYVKLQLLPGRQQRGKTRVLRNTVSPVYEEDFTFYGIQGNQLESLTLHFVVLSFDRYSRDDVIGEVVYPIAEVTSGDAVESMEVCKNICPRNIKSISQGRGELLVSLCHQPAASRLTVVVLKARNLPKMDITGSSDPYVKIYLVYKGQRVAKKKTHVKKRTLNPVFNESFVFDLPQDCHTLENIRLEFLLLDWDRVTKNEVIGRLELGDGLEDVKRISSALHHWKEVTNSPRRQIAEWHKLTE